ncbi:hypothetical protein GGH95_004072 [Coemansia sp. RSA 1836]|nr:hypothetical protein GGH95_004072 [Coemansia sp. RSA 1836]
MDRLVRDIQSQTIDLCTVDMISSFANIPYFFFYGNDASKPEFMTTELLRESFYTAVLDFPILVGHLVMDSGGRAKVVVDKDNLNLPEFLESHSDVHFRDVQDAKFGWTALPDGIATVGSLTTAGADGVIKFVNIHVVRLRDNSGVVMFANIPHYVVDGVGYCAFVNRWAEVCKWMRGGATAGTLPAFQGNFARSTLSNHLPETSAPLDETTRDLFAKSSPLSKWLAWISPKTRGAMLKTTVAMTPIEGHVFHVSKARLASLHALVQENVTSGERITNNDILTALISMAVAQSEAECKQAAAAATRGYLASLATYLLPSVFAQDSEFWAEIVCDARPRLPGLSAAQYTGNSVFVRCLISKLDALACGIDAQSLTLEAKKVRQLVDSVDSEFIGQLFSTLNSDPSCFMCPIVQVLAKTSIVVSNQSRFTLYGADFGDGIPVWVSPIKTFYANFASVLPVQPSTGGYAIYVTLSKQAMAKLLQNDFWMNSVELLY